MESRRTIFLLTYGNVLNLAETLSIINFLQVIYMLHSSYCLSAFAFQFVSHTAFGVVGVCQKNEDSSLYARWKTDELKSLNLMASRVSDIFPLCLPSGHPKLAARYNNSQKRMKSWSFNIYGIKEIWRRHKLKKGKQTLRANLMPLLKKGRYLGN